MKIKLDQFGDRLADYDMLGYVNHAIDNQLDIHVGNALVIDLIRAKLIKMSIELRPTIEWEFYGREVHFDHNLRSRDAWDEQVMSIWDRALEALVLEAKQ